jgi:hypothetical protein
MVSPRTADVLASVRAASSGSAWDWYQRALARPLARPIFLQVYAGCARRLAPVADAAREALLLHAFEDLSAADRDSLAEDVFFRGDNREREAFLRALPALPDPERHLPIAIEACRTNVASVFRAIACDNPYPAAHFPELNFNQMVLKAVFTGAPLSKVVGLSGRLNPELRRMAEDYARERRAAGRPVPEDIQLIT